MNDATQEQCERSLPRGESIDLINFCLEALYKDKEHGTMDLVSPYLTYEELIGALLKARRELQAAQR